MRSNTLVILTLVIHNCRKVVPMEDGGVAA